MKKLFVLAIITFFLSGCESINKAETNVPPSAMPNNAPTRNTEKNVYKKEKAAEQENDPFTSYPYLDGYLKDRISELRRLWTKFDSAKQINKGPTDDFHNSEYIVKFKKLLSEHDSINISMNDLRELLQQSGLDSFEAIVPLGAKEYHIRVIAYNVDYWVQAITDICDIKDKWIFIQCWNADEFYFTTVSDGDIHIATGFVPIIVNDKLNIIITGHSCPGYPQPPFLWAWSLDSDRLNPSGLFDFKAADNEKYELICSLDTQYPYKKKWTLHTDGSFIQLEKMSAAADNEPSPFDYQDVFCKTDLEEKTFIFSSTDRSGNEDSTISIKFKNGRFVVE